MLECSLSEFFCAVGLDDRDFRFKGFIVRVGYFRCSGFSLGCQRGNCANADLEKWGNRGLSECDAAEVCAVFIIAVCDHFLSQELSA
jgi:hypothetical protein